MVEHAANGGPRPGDPSLSLQERLEAIDPRGKPMHDGLEDHRPELRPTVVLPGGPELVVEAPPPPAPVWAGGQVPSKLGWLAAGYPSLWKREVME